MRALVWVVDDSPLDRQRAEAALSQECDVAAFTDGAAVLEALAAGAPPDVVVLDWVMPGVSGIEVVRFMRSQASRMRALPVLLLTALGDTAQIVEGLDVGANDYLAKPYSDPELRARVAALVRSSRMLERAQAAEDAVRSLLANTPDALLVVDAKGKVTYANTEAERVLGASGAALAGRDVDELLPGLAYRTIALGPGSPLVPLPDVTVAGRTLAPTLRILPTDAAPRSTVELRTTLALHDVTERRQVDARRIDFYSIMAHDLRSPLNAMLIRLDLMLKGRRGPLAAELLSELRKFEGSIRAMMKMIRDFLDLASMEGSGYRLERSKQDLAAVVSTILDEVRPVADASAVELGWVPPPVPCTVLGEAQRLAQVVSNLVGNAIKYTPPGGRVEVALREAGGAYEVAVRDTGPGIDADLVPVLFERFTRAPDAPRLGPGWGLGLMIVREIVEAHGGHVGVRSKKGEGSTFWFTLPRASAEPERAASG